MEPRFRPSFTRSAYPMPIPADFPGAANSHMNTGEIGAYMLILMEMWSRSTCDLPDDDAVLARICRTTKTIWKRQYAHQVRRLFETEDGRIFCPRLKQAAKRIRLPSSDRKPNRRPLRADLVRYVAHRDNGICHHCGVKVGKGEIDHLFPWSRGGTDDPSNLVLSCRACNRSKGAKTVEEWRAAR